jgi:glycosyltransferase involved in cell wall biosynthesis
MRVCWQGFLQGNHSWGIVGQSVCRELIKLGHSVDMFATQGTKHFPSDLKYNLIGYMDENTKQIYGKLPEDNYDIQLSYTAPPNFKNYLSHGNKNRFGIWAFEWQHLPTGFAKQHHNTDLILAPSQFAKYCFVNSGVPENKLVVVPHGVDAEQFKNNKRYQLKTKKRVIFFCNIGQAHLRKNIKGMFRSFMNAFTKNDDVCLVAKISKNKLSMPFEVDPIKIYNEVKESIKNSPEVELITEHVSDIVELYNVCDFVYTASFCEGFYMPGLECIFANKINICPWYGGQLDFLNDSNSVLINGQIKRAPLEEQYWQGSIKNTHFEIDVNDAIDKLRYCYNNVNMLKEKLVVSDSFKKRYDWNSVAKQILELVK